MPVYPAALLKWNLHGLLNRYHQVVPTHRNINMYSSRRAAGLLSGLAVFAGSLFPWQAQGQTHRLVVEFKQAATTNRLVQIQSFDQRMAATQQRVGRMAAAHKKQMRLVRPFGDQGAVLLVDDASSDAASLIERLRSDPDVVSVALDRRIALRAQSPLVGLLNGLDLSRQSRSWFHQSLASQPASINTGAMWTNFHGTSPTVVAVLDTGVLFDHPMVQGHLLPGYDFVTDPRIGADGQGSSASNSRDSDPADPGDGLSPADLAADTACTSGISTSSWHGTFVSGLLAGNPIASEGIFSVNWNASVLPVRVLGKCGGFSSDLADGIRWAAGLSVAGAPANPFPARVINLSLGAEGDCVSQIEGSAVAEARQAGALVVVAAGNEGSTVDSPANCPGAFGVAAVDQEGLKANYSNFGSTIQLSAPGGDGAFPIWSASNSGLYGPGTNTYNTKIGTSFSTPMVAAAASLYWSLNPSASVDTVESVLKSTARPFLNVPGNPTCVANQANTACNCTQALCGAGMLDVAAVVNQARAAGLTNLFSNTGNVIPPGGGAVFSAAGSTNASGAEVSAVSFDVLNVIKSSVSGADPTLSVSGLEATVSVPTGVAGFDLRATVAGGRSATVSISVANPGATTSTLLSSLLSPLINGATSGAAPFATDTSAGNGSVDGSSGASGASGGGGGGGGGSFGLIGLLWLASTLVFLRCGVKTKV